MADYLTLKMNGAVRSKAIWFGVILFTLIGICAVVFVSSSRRARAYFLRSRGLEVWAADARVLVEAGVTPDWCRSTRDALDLAIARVEHVHGTPFQKPIRVCICASQKSYNRRTGDRANGRARGAVFVGQVFLSPRVFETETCQGILTHELSHLHLRQIMGTRYTTRIPGWFQEGLAVYVSHGGGAEPVTPEDAIDSIQRGEQLRPEEEGRAIPRMASGHGLRHHMFYRQSGMFVEHLATSQSDVFPRFLSDLQEGERFAQAFRSCFGASPIEVWDAYVSSL